MQAFKRHSKSGIYNRTGAQTTTKVNRRTQGLRLHKQNFVEDGQNIISGQLYKQDSSLLLSGDIPPSMPRIKRELQYGNNPTAQQHQ